MRILILEDDSYRITTFIEKFGNHDITITDNAKDAISYLDTRIFDYIFLDHDLGINNGNGTEVAQYLYDNPANVNNKAMIIIHSWNKPAVVGMISRLVNSNTKYIPFNTADFFALNLDK